MAYNVSSLLKGYLDELFKPQADQCSAGSKFSLCQLKHNSGWKLGDFITSIKPLKAVYKR